MKIILTLRVIIWSIISVPARVVRVSMMPVAVRAACLWMGTAPAGGKKNMETATALVVEAIMVMNLLQLATMVSSYWTSYNRCTKE